jgi:hypothetical protein
MRTMLDTVLTYVASLAGLQAPAPAPDRKSLGTQPLYVVSRDRIIVPWSGTHTVFGGMLERAYGPTAKLQTVNRIGRS